MVHFTALVASSAALLSVAQAAPAAARHLRVNEQPARNASAAKRGLVAGAELIIGGYEHSTHSSKTSTKTNKANKASKATSKHRKAKPISKKVNQAARKSSAARAPCASPAAPAPDSLLSATVEAKLGHTRRSFNGTSLPAAGLPGFVEVATLVPGSALARAVAGLVSTAAQSNDPAAAFELTTSTTHSTQFYLVQATVQTALLDVVNVQLPVLNSATLESEAWCATFELAPPSAVTLQTCGPKEGSGQAFAWDRATGELRPLYEGVGAATNQAVVEREEVSSTGSATVTTADTTAAAASTTSATSATEPSASATSTDAPRTNQADAAPPHASDEPDAPAVKLYFVPASAYYQAPSFAASLAQANQADAALQESPAANATPNADASATATDVPSASGTASAEPLATVTVSSSIAAAAETSSAPAPAGPDSSPRQAYADVSATGDATASPSASAMETAPAAASSSETVAATPPPTAAKRVRRTTRW